MPAYLIRHPAAQAREDILVEDDDLQLDFRGGWAVFTDLEGVCLAIPTGQGASIERIDPDEEQQGHRPAGAVGRGGVDDGDQCSPHPLS